MPDDKYPPPLPSGLVTFMFTDIVGSTQMKKRMPGDFSREREEAFLERIKDPHDDIVAKRVKVRGGFIIKSTGDGFLIAFADAETAVLCAVEIQEKLNATAISTPDGPLQIRIGLNSGHAKPRGGDYTASAVDKAARVESKAGHGQVYLSRETHGVVLDRVRNIAFISAGNHDLKGVGEEELFVAFRAGQPAPDVIFASSQPKPDPIPKPPAFYAEPRYIGSHEFLGRRAQLDILDRWSASVDSSTILLFEAIGGAGKSMLTWEWTTKRAANTRGDWAGRFWYSFYERGAFMADFCRCALAYITGQPREDFRKKKTPELGELLLHHLQARSWLVVLDGLERVLVAYHRFDAAQLPDEKAGVTDEIANRDTCSSIRPEDDDLLRALAAAAPSKILITSRLIPRILLNPASQPIPGVLHKRLPGLRPADAEDLLRARGITGTSQDIQKYLQSNCDCHPLVTGVLAGLISDYLPGPGSFDAWVQDPAGGGQLNLAKLDLVQKRNHILHSALAALPKKSRQLLSTLALLSASVDYEALSALNPHLPPEPQEVAKPPEPKGWFFQRIWARRKYEFALQRYGEYEEALLVRKLSSEFQAAPQRLAETIGDLKRRGLLQYDSQSKRYDLHPVVRGVAAGSLRQEERERYGQRLMDHFSQQAHSPYRAAETLDDLHSGTHLVRILLQMGRHGQALAAYRGGLDDALKINLEAYAEVLTLLRPFFPKGWASLPVGIDGSGRSALAADASGAMHLIGQSKDAQRLIEAALIADLQEERWDEVCARLGSVSYMLAAQNRLSKEEHCLLLALQFRWLKQSRPRTPWSTERVQPAFEHEHFLRVASMRAELNASDVSRDEYNRHAQWSSYAQVAFWQGDLKEEILVHFEQLAKADNHRMTIRRLHGLRGEWHLARGQWPLAADSLHEAVRMAREVGQTDARAETQLAVAKFHLNLLLDPRQEALELAKKNDAPHRVLADLWLAIGDQEQAKKHAVMAYKWAWADGEPYVHRYELNKARTLMGQLGVEIPNLPPCDPAKDEKLSWEDGVAAAIEKLEAKFIETPETKLKRAHTLNVTDFEIYQNKWHRLRDLEIATPLGTFIRHNDGTFTDMTNKIMWIQAYWGLSYNGKSFIGEGIKLSWHDATKLFGYGGTIPHPAGLRKEHIVTFGSSEYEPGICQVSFGGHSDWRLPTAAEILTLGFCVTNSHWGSYPGKYVGYHHPADTKAQQLREMLFPDCPGANYGAWSANDNGYYAWLSDGHETLGDYKKEQKFAVLFVRSC